MYDPSFCSNDSSEYELNAETLDYLYKEQLETLRELVFKHNNPRDIELCRKWLKVFCKTSKAEKMARNCLCSLMQQQLVEDGALDEPFTNLTNCNRDLDRVLREVDDQSFITEQTETIRTYTSHRMRQQMYGGIRPISDGNGSGGDGDGNGVANIPMECAENATQTENLRLRNEMEALRLQLTEKDIEIARLKEIASKYQLQNTIYEELFDNFRMALLDGVRKSLQMMASEDCTFPFTIYADIYCEFESDDEFISEIKRCDTEFQQLLKKRFEQEFAKRKEAIAHHIIRKYGKSNAKLREKYERRLRVQTWAQRLQMKLVKLKCFSMLRKIFIDAKNEDKLGGDDKIWHMLSELEEKYQNVVKKIF